MHVQPPLSAGQPMPRRHDGVWPRNVPELPHGEQVSFISWAKAVARAQRTCLHDGDTRPLDAYSDREQCVLCDVVLPLAPLPEVDLDEGSDLAWAVALCRRPPSFPGVLALVELSRSVRRADASWALRIFAEEFEGLRQLGHTPRSYLALG